MKTNTDTVTLIAGFYAETYGEKIGDRDYTTEMLNLFSRLHTQAFPGYSHTPKEFVAQAKAQICGNELAVRNYYPVTFRFAPVSGDGNPLAVHMGSKNGTLGISADDAAINERIQSVLKAEE